MRNNAHLLEYQGRVFFGPPDAGGLEEAKKKPGGHRAFPVRSKQKKLTGTPHHKTKLEIEYLVGARNH